MFEVSPVDRLFRPQMIGPCLCITRVNVNFTLGFSPLHTDQIGLTARRARNRTPGREASLLTGTSIIERFTSNVE
jgi:hypothetical protein